MKICTPPTAKHPLTLFLLALALLGLPASTTLAQDAESVTVKDGETLAKIGGEWKSFEQELKFPDQIVISTNGTFTVNGGKEREIQEGQVLRKDGFLLSPDGSIAPIFDRLVKVDATTVMIYRDGVGSKLTQSIKLPNGLRVEPNGMMALADGTPKRMIAGQMYRLSGKPLPPEDSITLMNGTVYVQKEGVRYKIERGRHMVMNDGTKVYGNGRVVRFDGTERFLDDGETMTVPGVVVK